MLTLQKQACLPNVDILAWINQKRLLKLKIMGGSCTMDRPASSHRGKTWERG